MRSSNDTYIARLDHLRFLAATLVLLYHAVQLNVGRWEVSNPALTVITQGQTGVALFMVMSGYIFATLARDHRVAALPFLHNRFLRIYPLYLFAVLLGAYHARAELTQLLGALLPFINLTAPLDATFGQLWTIAVEVQFYLVFPFLWARYLDGGRRQLVGVLGLFVALRLLVYGADGTVEDLAYWTIFGRMDQFLIGMLLATTAASQKLRNPLWLVAGLGAVVGGTTLMDVHRSTGAIEQGEWEWIVLPTVEGAVWAFVVAAYVACSVGVPALLDRALAWLGRISFSMYVFHILVIVAIRESVGLLELVGEDRFVNALVQGVVLALPATVAVSALTYHLIEQPFLQRRSSYLVPVGPAGVVEPDEPSEPVEPVVAVDLTDALAPAGTGAALARPRLLAVWPRRPRAS